MDYKSLYKNRHYYSLSAFLQNKFGEKVYRVSIDAGFTCPNRDSSLGIGGCIYCNQQGARAGYVDPEVSVAEQIRKGIVIIKQRYGAKKFIAYFQAYTNTYANVEVLEQVYKTALEFPEIVGIAIGTRPDCIDEPKLDLIESIASKVYTIVEYGVQSLNPKTLVAINRKHSAKDSLRAIEMTKQRKNIDVLAHIIFGLPDETKDDMLNSLMGLIAAGIHSVKFHHLYVEKNTVLADWYNEGRFVPLDRKTYLDILVEAIGILPPNVVIHRLFGQSNKSVLIAPEWTLDKNFSLRLLDKMLLERNIWQGELKSPPSL